MTEIIDKLPPRFGPEDQLTTALHQALAAHPDLGQRLVDYLLVNAGLPAAKYQGAADHPRVKGGGRPDFLLKTAKFDIFCEHKLNGIPGNGQLEKYLNIKWPRSFYVALITNLLPTVPAAVQNHSRYLWPRTHHRPYYLWGELHPLVAPFKSQPAQNLFALLKLADNNSWQPPSVDGIAENVAITEVFSDYWRPTWQYFNEFQQAQQPYRNYFWYRADDDTRAGYGLKFRWLLPWVPILHFQLNPYLTSPEPRVIGPSLSARLYVSVRPKNLTQFQQPPGKITYQGIDIFTRPADYIYDVNKHCVFTYHAALSTIVVKNKGLLGKRLNDFALGVFEHIRQFEPTS